MELPPRGTKAEVPRNASTQELCLDLGELFNLSTCSVLQSSNARGGNSHHMSVFPVVSVGAITCCVIKEVDMIHVCPLATVA